jgi:hypothetical protein
MRRCSSSDSYVMYGSRGPDADDGATSSCSPSGGVEVEGVGGSSASVFEGERDDVDVRDCDSEGVSKNGSLGARARFGVAVVVDAIDLAFADGSG